jgi:hypothetical protein
MLCDGFVDGRQSKGKFVLYQMRWESCIEAVSAFAKRRR